ncbi:MAG: ribonuclease P protein component [Bacteroidota bacterium]
MSLRGRTAFQSLVREGQVFEGEFLKFFFTCSRSQPHPFRIGVIVGKRHGSSVCRNRLKRRIREACRHELRGIAEGQIAHSATLSAAITYRGSCRVTSGRVGLADLRADVAQFIRAIHLSLVDK